MLQVDNSSRSNSPLVIKTAPLESDWRLEEGDKPSRALQVVRELHARQAFMLNCVPANNYYLKSSILMQVPQADQAVAGLHQAFWLPGFCSSFPCCSVSSKKCAGCISGTFTSTQHLWLLSACMLVGKESHRCLAMQVHSTIQNAILPESTQYGSSDDVLSWLDDTLTAIWVDPVCGDGVCETPFEYASYGRFGCRADCGKLSEIQNLTTLQIDLYFDFTHPTTSIASSVSHNLKLAKVSVSGAKPDKKRPANVATTVAPRMATARIS